MKVAVVTPIPTPYRDPFWNVVSQREEIDLTVFYCAAGKGDRPWSGDWQRDYAWQVLPGRNLLAWKGSDASLYDNPGVVKALVAGDFDAVLIGGYNHLTMLRAIRWCIRHRVPYYLMCESHLESPRGQMRRFAKDRLLRWVVSNMAGGFPTGTLAERYLLHYGARPETLCHLPNAPDVERIRAKAEPLRGHREELRRELGFSERPTLLFVGRLISKKGAHLIIEAIAEIPSVERPDLVLVGDGPQRESLTQLAQTLNVNDSVRFSGFVEPADMVRWYVASDLFVLPSTETWGVVVSEALAAGVPVLVSDEVGCHPDTVSGSAAGSVVRKDDIAAWHSAFARRLETPGGVEQVAAAWQPVYDFLRYPHLACNLAVHLTSVTQKVAQARAVSAG